MQAVCCWQTVHGPFVWLLRTGNANTATALFLFRIELVRQELACLQVRKAQKFYPVQDGGEAA